MSIKKTLLLASMALAAIALAAPAGASALITHEEEEFNGTIGFTGHYKHETLGSGFECEGIESEATVANGGAEVEIKDFVINSPTTDIQEATNEEVGCRFFGSIYSGCKFEEHPNTANFPLTTDVSNDTTTLTVTKGTNGNWGEIRSELTPREGQECLFTTNDLRVIHDEEEELGVTLHLKTGEGGVLTGASLTGTVQLAASFWPDGGTNVQILQTVGASGTFTVDEPNTYVVEHP